MSSARIGHAFMGPLEYAVAVYFAVAPTASWMVPIPAGGAMLKYVSFAAIGTQGLSPAAALAFDQSRCTVHVVPFGPVAFVWSWLSPVRSTHRSPISPPPSK